MSLDTSDKIRSRHDAVAWREAQRGIVVFTNGVFDLVHPGHVILLEAGRREGDALVVGVNGDGSARRLGKGPGRPIVPAHARARVMAAFAAVDCVVIFDEDTPLELIQALEPDVLVKGNDYTKATTVGADIVMARGGRVKHVELADGYSTSAILERLRVPT
ncbi:MAG TPA: adenylyltransferase/cytidyltransferase family protein [Gemmatimonadales bacterium]|jgi:D-beta-D-heptose 7-phosphate kinase/D-beta-D-heptose 1-phosphate adenosyltransferase